MNYKAFSLIELIVWITISMMLMVSVGVFISSWMQNILIQQKVLENTDNFTNFATNLHTSFNLIQSWSIIEKTSSWILFKRWQNFWEGGFTYIWTQTQSWIYCESDSEDPETNSIFIKNFIPFEERNSDNTNEDIFTDDSYEIKVLRSKLILWYQSFQKEHVIKYSWNTIIWKWIFWDKFIEWASWTDIYLNSPTWIVKDWNILYISDTLNNKVLYYKINEDEIYTLLNESDWLNEPTWLYYIDSTLYISNSWRWEILKYSSKSSIDRKLNIDFTINQSINNLKKFEIEFFTWITDITNPNNLNDFTLNWLTKYTDYLTWSTNKITYWFSDFNNNYSTIVNSICTSDYEKYYEESDNIIKEEVTDCNSSTWTIKKYKSNIYQNISNAINIQIGTTAVTWTNFSTNWNYYTKLNLIWDSNYSEYFPHFTEWDDDLTTPDDNILTIHRTNLNYPTWIWWTWNSDYNEFWNLPYWNLTYHTTDTLLLTPIKSLTITNSANELITFLLKYYKRYNCYNLDDYSEKTFLLKKNLK